MRDALYSPLNTHLRERLKAARKKAGLTQVDLAKATGRTQAYISKFENGQLRLDVEDYIIFCKVVGLNAKTLLSELERFVDG